MSNLIEKVVAMANLQGTVFSFDGNTSHDTALDEIFKLLKGYYSEAYDKKNYLRLKGLELASVCIEPNPQKHEESRKLNKMSYKLVGGYTSRNYNAIIPIDAIYGLPLDKIIVNEDLIGFIDIWHTTVEHGLVYNIRFAVRKKEVGSEFNDIDMATKEAMSFLKYAQARIASEATKSDMDKSTLTATP